MLPVCQFTFKIFLGLIVEKFFPSNFNLDIKDFSVLGESHVQCL